MAVEVRSYQKVSEISEVGRYVFAEDPNAYLKAASQGRDWSYPAFVNSTGSTHEELAVSLRKYVQGEFSHLWSIRFHQATLEEGEYTPAYLEYLDRWGDPLFGLYPAQGEFIVHQGQVTRAQYDMGWQIDHFQTSITFQDTGGISIEKNQLVVPGHEERNGLLHLIAVGRPQSRWKADILLVGDKPGLLIQASVGYLNDFKRQHQVPLWRASE